MQLTFSVGGKPAVLDRNWLTGRFSIAIDGKTTLLQSPWSLSTQLSFQTNRSWQIEALGHRIFIEKSRPLLFSGFLPQTYRIKVDGELVVEQAGY